MQHQFSSVHLFRKNSKFPSHTQLFSFIVQLYHIEKFLAKEMGQHFTLIFEVGQIEEVRASNPKTSKFEKKL